MLSKALHRKFKNTHCTSSDEDDSDSNFSSSSESEEESEYSSSESDTDSESEEDADTASCNSDAEDDMKVVSGENSMVCNASSRSTACLLWCWASTKHKRLHVMLHPPFQT